MRRNKKDEMRRERKDEVRRERKNQRLKTRCSRRKALTLEEKERNMNGRRREDKGGEERRLEEGRAENVRSLTSSSTVSQRSL